jgi:hypothetical protein
VLEIVAPERRSGLASLTVSKYRACEAVYAVLRIVADTEFYQEELQEAPHPSVAVAAAQ